MGRVRAMGGGVEWMRRLKMRFSTPQDDETILLPPSEQARPEPGAPVEMTGHFGRNMGQCCRGCCDQSACAALDSARYNMGDKHCPVRINQVHVFEKLLDAHVAGQQYAVDLLALLE
jgi:hypothetical protein